jgi:hypothetical protein
MATTITAGNATNGLAFSADGTGILELKTGTGSGTTAVTISTAQAVTFAGNVSGVIKSGTAVASTSGTSIDFTGIPSTAKRITVMFNGVSTNGSSKIILQLGDAGGIETTGYSGSVGFVESSIAATNFSTGFIVEDGTSSTAIRRGLMTINLFDSLTWVESSNVARSDGASICVGAGTKTLSDTLTQLRITTVNGTDTFDAGSINILYE